MSLERHAFTLQLTERCNLACRYCYVRRRRDPDHFDCTPDFCEKFVDFACQASREKLKITFFGGEPLLRPELIRHTVACARQRARDIGFHLVTNGTLLDEASGDFLADEGIGLEISIDGPESVHDRNRIYADGSPSFREVYGNLLGFVERHPDHPVSIFSVMDSPDSLPWLRALCRGIDAERFTLNPMREAYAGRDHAGRRKILMGSLNRRIHLYEAAFFAGDPDNDPEIGAQMACLLGSQETNRCEAGINSTIVTRTGDIYPCPFFVGHKDQVIGHILHGFFPDRVIPYVERYRSAMKSCKACGARPVCGSGCAFDSYEETGRVDVPSTSACKNTRAYVHRLGTSLVRLAAAAPEEVVDHLLKPKPGPVSRPNSPEWVNPCGTPSESFVVRLTGRCNLACDYCYEKANPARDNDLDFPTARKVIRHILESPVVEPLVCLFGGEPLLNWEMGEFLIEEIAKQAKQAGKRPFFHLTTNGTLLTPGIARTVRRHGITVQISVDGPMENHDRHRKYRDGSGSWAVMCRGMERLRQENPEAVIDGQVVLTPGNTDMKAIAGYLKKMGFRRISFLVAGWEAQTGISWSEKEITALMKAREDFFPFFIESAIRGNAEVDMGFAGLVAVEPLGPTGLCECGTGEVFIDSRARIHRCPQLYAMGCAPMAECGPPDAAKKTGGPHRPILKTKCLSCRAYDRCRGGCVVRNQQCPWMPSQVPPGKEKFWCELMRAEFDRAILAHRILESRRPKANAAIKAMFGV